jgi:hypothetical protein
MYPPAMPDPEAQPPEPAPPGVYLPYAAYRAPVAEPTFTKAYEHPTARRVVSTGLQLAVESSRDVRRASIYIGVLALAAFGPAVLLLLLGLARLLSDASIASAFFDDPTSVFIDQPGLAGPATLISVLVSAAGVLLIGISVDAQAMAISILGGRAADQPIRLWEAVVRARQVFWRLLAANLMIGVTSAVIGIVITLVFFRPFESNTGVSFIGSMIGTLVVTPFVFSAAGIVLGDVPAVEALRRSWALFRARPRIALVVSLFSLVTAAIQQFAFGAGSDAAGRVAQFLHLGLDQGGLSLALTVVIVLAFIVAFGSLTFTIAAIVAAPQVTGFLGLTYYSAGLDRARSADGLRPRRFRWVSVPMLVIMVAMVAIAGIGLPSVTGFQTRPVSAILTFLRVAAAAEGSYVSAYGPPQPMVEDPVGDGGAGATSASDMVGAEHGALDDVPTWLLDGVFACDAPGVTCASGGSQNGVFAAGALLFAQRVATSPSAEAAGASEQAWGPVLRIDGAPIGPSPDDDRFPEASHAYVTRGSGKAASISRYRRQPSGSFVELPTNARSLWVRDALITLIPRAELNDDPLSWDMFACGRGVTLTTDSCDFLRATPTSVMRDFVDGPNYLFIHAFALQPSREP